MRRRKREAHEPGIGYADTLCEGLTNWHPLGRRPAAPTLGVCNQNPWSRLSRLCGHRNVVSIVTPPRTGGKHALWSARYPTRCATAPVASTERWHTLHRNRAERSTPLPRRVAIKHLQSSIRARVWNGRRSVLDIQLSLAELADAELIAITRCQVT